jgi:hypothetical protein
MNQEGTGSPYPSSKDRKRPPRHSFLLAVFYYGTVAEGQGTRLIIGSPGSRSKHQPGSGSISAATVKHYSLYISSGDSFARCGKGYRVWASSFAVNSAHVRLALIFDRSIASSATRRLLTEDLCDIGCFFSAFITASLNL